MELIMYFIFELFFVFNFLKAIKEKDKRLISVSFIGMLTIIALVYK